MNYHSPPPPPGGYYTFTSPSPSPQGPHGYYTRPGPSPRMHTRHQSQDYAYSPRATTYPSPRYSSNGQYSTRAGYSSPPGNVEYVSARPRKSSRSSRHHHQWSAEPSRESQSYHRASYGDSDEDEYVEYDGHVYVLRARRPAKSSHHYRGRSTDRYYYSQDHHAFAQDRAEYNATPLRSDTPHRSRSRRASASTPQRPSTGSRPTSSSKKAAPPPPKATEADAKKHRIPAGYSLKNWDPTEEPIMLLGSVFDANSLGKWIYDWTVYHHGPATPISDMAGELWLLLIQLAGKVKRSEECMPRIRSQENREMVDDFIEGGERLMDKLKKLLKACETPMLRAGKRHGKEQAQLGKNAGTEFVDSIFGRDRQLDNTEKFMSSIRLWNLRFDANCEDILRRPYA